MLFTVGSVVGLGFLIFKFIDSYCRRTLGFDSMNHDPMFIPGTSSSKSAVVCVLGWGGCTRRQLRRLLDFYSSNGVPTISWINPMFSFFFGIDQKQVERVLDLLLIQYPNSDGIFIHLHSNNGVFVFGHMIQLMKTQEKYSILLEQIKGVILDSAPFVVTRSIDSWIVPGAIGASRPCVSIILNRPQYLHWFWTPIIVYYLSIRFFDQRYLRPIASGSPHRIRDFINSIPNTLTQYYLYSDADRLISHTTIEQFMVTQVKRGVHVMSHRFADSEHVNHFRLHPEEYGRVVLQFINSKSNKKSH